MGQEGASSDPDDYFRGGLGRTRSLSTSRDRVESQSSTNKVRKGQQLKCTFSQPGTAGCLSKSLLVLHAMNYGLVHNLQYHFAFDMPWTG